MCFSVNNHIKLAYEEGRALAQAAAQADYLDEILSNPKKGLLAPARRDFRKALKHRDLMAVSRESLGARAVRNVLSPLAVMGSGALTGATLGAVLGVPSTGAALGVAGAAPLALSGEGRRLVIQPRNLRRRDAAKHLMSSPTGRLAGRAALLAALGGVAYSAFKD